MFFSSTTGLLKSVTTVRSRFPQLLISTWWFFPHQWQKTRARTVVVQYFYLLVPFWYDSAAGETGRAKIPMARPNEPHKPPSEANQIWLLSGIHCTQIQPSDHPQVSDLVSQDIRTVEPACDWLTEYGYSTNNTNQHSVKVLTVNWDETLQVMW